MHRQRIVQNFVFLLLLLFAAVPASAEVANFGMTPSAGAVGDGRLTVQVSSEGTIFCMRWPNATYYEHTKYKGGFWNDDPAKNDYLKPHYGAQESDGFFAGVRVVTGTTTLETTVMWLRDAKPTFAYANEDANRLVATYTFESGLTIQEETFNVPDKPHLIRRYRLVSAPANSTVDIIAFANPALRDIHGDYAPNGDYEDDADARYGTFVLVQEEAILSALPGANRGVDPVKALYGKSDADVAAFVEANKAKWGEGIYMAQGASVAWTDYQVGGDHLISTGGPTDAYLDVANGSLEKNNVVAEYETTAIMFPIKEGDDVAWYAAFGTKATEAMSELATARNGTPGDWANQSDNWWKELLSTAVLPSGDLERQFSKRALISLRTGTDPESGAVVASTSCQPPYNVDWPRDGAFFQFALNMNGFDEAADRHARFYPHIQYTEPGEGLTSSYNSDPKKANPNVNGGERFDLIGRFPMNAFADYVPGGPIDFEIDNLGFALWLYRVHAGFVSQNDPAAARQFILDISDSIKMGADLLVLCKDDANDLHCPANEDDNLGYEQTLHGAITTWLGLKASAEMFEAVGKNSHARRYRARVAELDAAIRKHFDPAGGYTVHPQQLAWSYWPANFWSEDDQNTNVFAIESMIANFDKSLFGSDSRGSQYTSKSAIALQLPPLRDPSNLTKVGEVHDFFLTKMMRQDTMHLGEFTNFNDIDGDGEKEFINVVATPHIWAQTLVYLSLVAAEMPEKLQVPDIKRVASSGASAGGGGGCGCSTANGNGVGGIVIPAFLVVGFAVWRRRR